MHFLENGNTFIQLLRKEWQKIVNKKETMGIIRGTFFLHGCFHNSFYRKHNFFSVITITKMKWRPMKDYLIFKWLAYVVIYYIFYITLLYGLFIHMNWLSMYALNGVNVGKMICALIH